MSCRVCALTGSVWAQNIPAWLALGILSIPNFFITDSSESKQLSVYLLGCHFTLFCICSCKWEPFLIQFYFIKKNSLLSYRVRDPLRISSLLQIYGLCTGLTFILPAECGTAQTAGFLGAEQVAGVRLQSFILTRMGSFVLLN